MEDNPQLLREHLSGFQKDEASKSGDSNTPEIQNNCKQRGVEDANSVIDLSMRKLLKFQGEQTTEVQRQNSVIQKQRGWDGF
jgi:hypothetical protein